MKFQHFLPPLPLRFSRFATTLAAGLLAGACSGPYTVTLNEAVVYTPIPGQAGNVLRDPNFQGCLNQVLMNIEDRELARVTTLACPNAGISSLAGIESLANLEQLDLSGNGIMDISPLAGLRNLRVLSVRDNDIRSIAPLLNLPTLRFIALQGNDNLPCRQLDNLQAKVGNSLSRPLECIG